MNRKLVFPLFLLLAVALQGCGLPFIGYSSHTDDSRFFEDDQSNSYYATAGDLLKEIMRTNDTEELAILGDQLKPGHLLSMRMEL